MTNTTARPARPFPAPTFSRPGPARLRFMAALRFTAALSLVLAALFAPALAGVLLMIGAAVLIRPASELGRGALSLLLGALAVLTGMLTLETVPGSCAGVFAVAGVLYMALATWTSLRK